MSIGAALSQSGDTTDTLFKVADAALYEAKRTGRGRAVFADAALRWDARAQARTEDELVTAFDLGQMVCLYQPVIDLDSGRMVSVEALVRWRHPELGLLDADRFLPAVERMGLGDRLFVTVLSQALSDQRRWSGATGCEVPVMVNISSVQLSSQDVAERVREALEARRSSPDALSLVVTKVRPLDAVGVAALQEIHDLGVRIVLSGFGSGWSSLLHLARIPWDSVRIDRGFVVELSTGESAEDVVAALTAMARALDLRVGADGVSRMSQLEKLTRIGCDVAQGPLFQRTATAAEVTEMLRTGRTWRMREAHPPHQRGAVGED